jgi:lysophospholipase
VGDLGHVGDYAEYQSDVAAMLATVRAAGLPEPFVLLAHSMGGAIGLRALAEGLPVRAAAFSAPMWGIHIAVYLRPLAHGFSAVGRRAGLGLREVPVGRRESYLSVTPFADNALTTDLETYDWMVAQALRDPRLALGRPTIQWLHASLAELRRLRSLPPPPVPVLVGLAGEETIVDNGATLRLARGWPGARLETYAGARHELLMERADVRSRFLDAALDLFSETARAPAPASSWLRSPHGAGHDAVGPHPLLPGAPYSASTTCRCRPSPSMPASMTSPGFRNRGGVRPIPTPAGVPVATMSPG